MARTGNVFASTASHKYGPASALASKAADFEQPFPASEQKEVIDFDQSSAQLDDDLSNAPSADVFMMRHSTLKICASFLSAFVNLTVFYSQSLHLSTNLYFEFVWFWALSLLFYLTQIVKLSGIFM